MKLVTIMYALRENKIISLKIEVTIMFPLRKNEMSFQPVVPQTKINWPPCLQSLGENSCWNNHIRFVHGQENTSDKGNDQCNICTSKPFSQVKSLKAHIK